ncbi:hypothetical protein quinque_007357 [Culex quinquefasciatus]
MEQAHLELAIELGCQSYITITEGVNSFFDIKLAVKDRTSQRRRDKYFLIFVEKMSNLENNRFSEEAFNFYPNLWFVTPSKNLANGFDFYTQNFTKSGSTKLYQENSFNVEKSSFTSNASLFYDKLSNLGGRSIRTGIVDYVPYGTTEFVGANRGNVDALNSSLSKELHTEGFEGTLIVEFCKFYKCNLKVWPFGPDNWGYINDAENGEGMLFSPLSKKTEIIISSIYYQWICQFLDYSRGLASVLTVPRYGKSLDTIHDFAQSPYRWGVPAIAWILAIVDAESVDLKAVVKKFDVIPDEENFYHRTLSGDFGVGIEFLNSQKITVGPYIREDNVHLFQLPKEMLYYSYTTVAAQRGWPVMEQLNHFILLANQHGLVLHWERRALRKNQSTRMEVALDPTISTRQKDEFRAAVEQAMLLHRVPTVWIAAGTDRVEAQLKNAIEIGCQSYMTFTDNPTSFLEMKLYLNDRTAQRIRDTNFLMFYENVTSLNNHHVFREAMNYYPNFWIIEGLEGNLIIEFCKLRNCNLKLLPFGPDNWGYIDENGTGDGMLYATYLKKTELSICCTSFDWVQDILDGSQSIAYSSMKILVPRAKLLPTYLTPVYPFSSKLWISIFLTLTSMTVVLHGITALNSFRDALDQPAFVKSIFDTIAIFLDQGIFLNLSTHSYRSLICFIMLSGVVLSNSYSGVWRYRWAAPSIAWTFTIADAETPDLQAVVRKIEVIADPQQLYQRSLRGDIGIGIELLNSQKFYEITYYDYTAGVSQRGWPLMGYFDKFVLEVVQGGFVIYWEREMLRKFQSNRLALALEPIITGRRPDVVVQRLAVGHILGPLYLLFMGTAVAAVVFVLELVWYSAKGYRKDRRVSAWE